MQNQQTRFGTPGLIGMHGCEKMAEKIDRYLCESDMKIQDDSILLEYICHRFANGEGKGVINHTVRGYDLYILADMFNHGVTYRMYGKNVPMGPDNHFQDLKRIIAATNGKARRINVIMPLLYEGRQDCRYNRESLDCALALQELVRMGVENIITFDAHDARVQNAIPLAGFENIRPAYQMIRALIRDNADNILLDKDNILIVSPDEGGMERCIYYSDVLDVELSMCYKIRDHTRYDEDGRNPVDKHEFLGGDLNGRDVIVVDDIIDSGTSILKVANTLKSENNAGRIFVFASFGLFSAGLDKFDDAYKQGVIERIYSTNLIYQTPELLERGSSWYRSVDMSKFLAYIIKHLNYDHSISELLHPRTKIKKLIDEARKA